MRYRGGGVGHSDIARPPSTAAEDLAEAGRDECELAEPEPSAAGGTASQRLPAEGPGGDDAREAPPEVREEELDEEAADYGYIDPEDDGVDGTHHDDDEELETDDLGAEDGEDGTHDDPYGEEGFAPP